MTFFYDLNKRLSQLDAPKSTQLNEGKEKPDFLDLDKDGDKEEPMKSAAKSKFKKTNESSVNMSEDDMEEGNEFSGELAKAKAAGAKEFKVDGKTYQVKESDVSEGSTGDYSAKKARAGKDIGKPGKNFSKIAKDAAERYGSKERGEKVAGAVLAKLRGKNESVDEATKEIPGGRRHEAEPGGYGRKDDEEAPKVQATRGRGRPKKGSDETGDVKKYDWSAFGAAGKDVKLPKWDKSKTTKHKMVGEQDIHPADRGEYDREGDMAKTSLATAKDAAAELRSILDSDENLPEWVQSKITKAVDYLDTARDYMKSKKDEEPVQEKAVSKAQQKFMGMVHAAQKGEKPASKEVAKVAKSMGKKDAEDFASTKHKGLPEKKKKEKEVDETTTSGAFATATATPSKSKGGMSFGKGIYDSWNRELENMISESINVSVNMSNQGGQPTKNITVSAEGEDADRLAELLQMSGLGGHGHGHEGECETCHQTPCACGEQVDENQPDWPTNTEYSDDVFQYSGGLNKPKSTGQTTTPVIASQTDRQVAYEGEHDDNEELRLMKERAGIADGKYTQHAMDLNRPSKVKPESEENPAKTPWKQDPIAAATDRIHDKFTQLYKAYKQK